MKTGPKADLKGAIAKYLKDEWGSKEQGLLIQLRYAIASKAVPNALSFSNAAAPVGTIEEYITILTKEPGSERGKVARQYLSSLMAGKVGTDTHEITGIEAVAKLRYISAAFLLVQGKIEYGRMTYSKNDRKTMVIFESEEEVMKRNGKVNISVGFSADGLL